MLSFFDVSNTENVQSMNFYCPLTDETQLSKSMIRKISILLRKNFISFLPLSGSDRNFTKTQDGRVVLLQKAVQAHNAPDPSHLKSE